LDHGDQHSDEDCTAAYHGDPAGQDEFATALDPGDELIDLRLKPHNFVTMIAVVHGATL
jgi:hypothetical protein